MLFPNKYQDRKISEILPSGLKNKLEFLTKKYLYVVLIFCFGIQDISLRPFIYFEYEFVFTALLIFF